MRDLREKGIENYNIIVKLCYRIFILDVLLFLGIFILCIMFYKANFTINNTNNNSNNSNNTQIVNIDNSKKYDKININKCSFEALDNLTGIGEVKAKRIIENRPYKDVYELRKIIGETTFDNIKEYIAI